MVYRVFTAILFFCSFFSNLIPAPLSATDSLVILIFLTTVFYVFTLSGGEHRNLIYDLYFDPCFIAKVWADPAKDLFLIHLCRISVQPDRIILHIFLDETILLHAFDIPEIVCDDVRCHGIAFAVVDQITSASVKLGQIKLEATIRTLQLLQSLPDLRI